MNNDRPITDPETIPDGTRVAGKPIGWEQRERERVDWDVPEYSGIGPTVEGPLEKIRSSTGEMVFVVAGVPIET